MILTKSKLQRSCHKKSGSPGKRRGRLESVSAYAYDCQFTTNMERVNPFPHPSLQDQRIETISQFNRNAIAMEMNATSNHFYPHGYSLTMDLRPSLPVESAVASEDWFPEHHFNSHARHLAPQTPFPRSWDLISPPKPRRLASIWTPFPVPQSSYSYPYPVQARYAPSQVPRNIKMSTVYHQVVGHPSLKIFRLRLPPHLLHLLDGIVLGCEAHAATLPSGWWTELYSLTKQDIALRKIPYLYNAVKPITSYMKRSIMALMRVQTIKMDRNQPHVLKYSTEDGHTGVGLHHDKCDVTVNLCLSRSTSYVGGGYVLPVSFLCASG